MMDDGHMIFTYPDKATGKLARISGKPAYIAACVNACEGIADPGVVPELVDAATLMVEARKNGDDHGEEVALEFMRAALARVRGDGE